MKINISLPGFKRGNSELVQPQAVVPVKTQDSTIQAPVPVKSEGVSLPTPAEQVASPQDANNKEN